MLNWEDIYFENIYISYAANRSVGFKKTRAYICFFLRFLPIHQEAPAFVDMSVEAEILVTGIKVVDLLAPYAKGGKIG